MSLEGIEHKPNCPAKIVSHTFPWKTTLKSSGSLAIASTVGGLAITIIFFVAPSILGSLGAFALIGPVAVGGISTLVLFVVGGVKTACKQRCSKPNADLDQKTYVNISINKKGNDSDDTSTDSYTDSDSDADMFFTPDGSENSQTSDTSTCSEGEEVETKVEVNNVSANLKSILKKFADKLVTLHSKHVPKSDSEGPDLATSALLDQAIATLCSVDWNWNIISLEDVTDVKEWLVSVSSMTPFSGINRDDLEIKAKWGQEFVSIWNSVIALVQFGFDQMKKGEAILDLDAQIEARLIADTKDMSWINQCALNNPVALALRKGIVKIAVTSVLSDFQAAAYARNSAKSLFVDGEYNSHTPVDIGDLENLTYQRIMDDIIYDSKEIRFLFQVISKMAPSNRLQDCQNALLNLIEILYPVYYSLVLSDTPGFSRPLADLFGKLPNDLEDMNPSKISLPWFTSLIKKVISGHYAAHDSTKKFSD